MAISFDTPQSSTDYQLYVTGTVAARKKAHVMVKLNVVNTGTYTRNETFYQEVDYDNTTGTHPSQFTGTLHIAITPATIGSDVVTPTISKSY